MLVGRSALGQPGAQGRGVVRGRSRRAWPSPFRISGEAGSLSTSHSHSRAATGSARSTLLCTRTDTTRRPSVYAEPDPGPLALLQYSPAPRSSYLRISCSANSCDAESGESGSRSGSQRGGRGTHHVGDRVLDAEHVLALRAHHLAVGDHNLRTSSAHGVSTLTLRRQEASERSSRARERTSSRTWWSVLRRSSDRLSGCVRSGDCSGRSVLPSCEREKNGESAKGPERGAQGVREKSRARECSGRRDDDADPSFRPISASVRSIGSLGESGESLEPGELVPATAELHPVELHRLPGPHLDRHSAQPASTRPSTSACDIK